MKVEYTVSLRIEKTVYDDEYNVIDEDINHVPLRIFYQGNDAAKAKHFFDATPNLNPNTLERLEKSLEPTIAMLQQPSR